MLPVALPSLCHFGEVALVAFILDRLVANGDAIGCYGLFIEQFLVFDLAEHVLLLNQLFERGFVAQLPRQLRSLF